MQTSESTQLRRNALLFFVQILTALVAASGLTAAAATDAAPPPPGKLVNAGGYKLHLNCTGGNKNAGPPWCLRAVRAAFRPTDTLFREACPRSRGHALMPARVPPGGR